MERLHVSIPFFLGFPTFTSKYGLPEVYSQPSLNVQTTLLKVWHFPKGGSVSAIHPPLANLTFVLQDVALTATPFCKGWEGDTTATCADLQKVHQQLNYTNTAISTITTQLYHVANRVDASKGLLALWKHMPILFPNHSLRSKVSRVKITTTLRQPFLMLRYLNKFLNKLKH